MGAENSVIEDCEWGETLTDGHWTIKNGRFSDDTEVSLFTCQGNEKKKANLLRSYTKQLRSIRHPCILHYVGSEEGTSEPYLLTEKVVPLRTVLDSLSSIEICAGLHSVLEGLAFLHDQAKISHNNVHLGAVYVSTDGTWRLGGLEHSCKFTDATPTFLESCRAFRDETSISPEEKAGKMATDLEYCYARDVYSLAVLIEILLEKMEDLGDMTKTFELRIQDECLNLNPKDRPTVQSLLQDRLFTTEFLEIASFLKHITLKTEQERKPFFRDLLPKLLNLPEDLIGRRLVPSLLSRFVMLDQSAVEYVLPSLLTPCTENRSLTVFDGRPTPLLRESMYRQYIIPKLVKVFCVRDFHIHLTLLTYFHLYMHLIDKEVMELDVFPQVLLGLRDTSDQISSLSLHALADMVPILGRDVVIGGKSKKFFKEGRPKQSTVCASPNPAFNNKMSNVRGVMENVLLKDLAKLSEKKSPIKANEDRDRKWKEREKKREEMKKRREERKLAREKLKDEATQYTTVEDGEEVKSSFEKSSQKYISNQEAFQDTFHVISETKVDTNLSEEDVSSVLNTSVRSDWSKKDDDFIAVTKDKADWSDWDNKGDDSDYSDEIERELESMDAEKGNISTVNTSKPVKTYTHSPRAMKLVSEKATSMQKNISENSDPPVQQAFKSTSSSIIPKQPKVKVKSASNQQQLGLEFDIKTLDIKIENKSQDPFDFFADMAPKIESKAPSSSFQSSGDLDLPLSNGDGRSGGELETNNTAEGNKISFDVLNATAEVTETEAGDGWGDEDW